MHCDTDQYRHGIPKTAHPQCCKSTPPSQIRRRQMSYGSAGSSVPFCKCTILGMLREGRSPSLAAHQANKTFFTLLCGLSRPGPPRQTEPTPAPIQSAFLCQRICTCALPNIYDCVGIRGLRDIIWAGLQPTTPSSPHLFHRTPQDSPGLPFDSSQSTPRKQCILDSS